MCIVLFQIDFIFILLQTKVEPRNVCGLNWFQVNRELEAANVDGESDPGEDSGTESDKDARAEKVCNYSGPSIKGHSLEKTAP